MIKNIMVRFTWRMINRGHALKQIYHEKNVEARAKKVVVGVKYIPQVLSKFSQCWEVFIHFIEGCC